MGLGASGGKDLVGLGYIGVIEDYIGIMKRKWKLLFRVEAVPRQFGVKDVIFFCTWVFGPYPRVNSGPRGLEANLEDACAG